MSEGSDINWTTVRTKYDKIRKVIQFGVSSEQDRVILGYLADEYPHPIESPSGLDGPFFTFDLKADAWLLKTAADQPILYIRPDDGNWLIRDDETVFETVIPNEIYSKFWTDARLEKNEDVPLEKDEDVTLEKDEDVLPLKDGTVVGSFRPGDFVVEIQETPDSEWTPSSRFLTKKSAMERASITTEIDMVPTRVVYREFVHEDVKPEWWGE